MIVHHIEMDDVGPGGEHRIHFLSQTGKVGGEDGGGNEVISHRQVTGCKGATMPNLARPCNGG